MAFITGYSSTCAQRIFIITILVAVELLLRLVLSVYSLWQLRSCLPSSWFSCGGCQQKKPEPLSSSTLHPPGQFPLLPFKFNHKSVISVTLYPRGQFCLLCHTCKVSFFCITLCPPGRFFLLLCIHQFILLCVTLYPPGQSFLCYTHQVSFLCYPIPIRSVFSALYPSGQFSLLTFTHQVSLFLCFYTHQVSLLYDTLYLPGLFSLLHYTCKVSFLCVTLYQPGQSSLCYIIPTRSIFSALHYTLRPDVTVMVDGVKHQVTVYPH